MGCLTQLCSTIQIVEVLIDDPQKLGCSTGIIPGPDYVQLMFIWPNVYFD